MIKIEKCNSLEYIKQKTFVMSASESNLLHICIFIKLSKVLKKKLNKNFSAKGHFTFNLHSGFSFIVFLKME